MITVDQGLVLPDATDNRNVPLSFSDYSTGVESRLVKRYASVADRTLRNPSPTEGELSYLLDLNRFEYYDGAAWTQYILPNMPRGLLARAHRATSSSTTATVTGVLRLDDVPVLTGRAIHVYTGGLHLDSTVANDVIEGEIRFTTDGSTPTTASAVLPGARAYGRQQDAAWPETRIVRTVYIPPSDLLLSLLLCVRRFAGSGSVSMFADADHSIEMFIEDGGLDVGDAGTDI